MTSEYKEVLHKIGQDLASAENKQEELEYIVEIGKQLTLDKSLAQKTECRVTGCASSTFVSLISKDNTMTLHCYTDSYVVAGYLYICKKCIDGAFLDQLHEILENIKQFASEYGLNVSHIPSRADAFSRILETIETNQ